MLTATLAVGCYPVAQSAQAAPSGIKVSVAGPEETVYHWGTSKCEDDDIPDDAARAYRDSSNTVHLIASQKKNRAMIGRDLDHVVKSCHIIFRAGQNSNPMSFDNEGWIESIYTEDGINIHALISMDYHPERYHLPCYKAEQKGDCWYSTLVAAQSHDNGESFSLSPDIGQRFVSGSAFSFDPRTVAVVGSLVPSNILKISGLFYVLFSVAGYGDQVAGECVMRTSNLDDARSWRAWDGSKFDIKFTPPKTNEVLAKPDNVCATLKDLTHAPVRSVSKIGDHFIAVSYDSGVPKNGIKSRVVAQTSLDLIHWSAPTTVVELPLYVPGGTHGETAYFYPSLLDPKSSSRNFDEVGMHPYIYMTRYVYGAGLDRDLIRFPLSISE